MSLIDLLFIGVIMPMITGLIMMCLVKIDERRRIIKRYEPKINLEKTKKVNWKGDYGQYK